MSRTLTDVLARRFDEDAALIEEMLALTPDRQADWRPLFAPAFTLAELAQHLVTSWGGVNACLCRLHPERLAHFDTLRERIAQAAHGPLPVSRELWTAGRAHSAEGFALVTDADLARVIPTYFHPGGQPFLEILLTNLKHVNHHAHQLFIYLKLLEVPVESRHLYRFNS